MSVEQDFHNQTMLVRASEVQLPQMQRACKVDVGVFNQSLADHQQQDMNMRPEVVLNRFDVFQDAKNGMRKLVKTSSSDSDSPATLGMYF